MAESCPNIPADKTREAIERTEKTGNEHGFVVCPDGETGEMTEGGKTGMSLDDSVCSVDGRVTLVHTHPNGAMRLSDQDRRVLSRDDIEAVCVANADSSDGAVVCERTKPKCEMDL